MALQGGITLPDKTTDPIENPSVGTSFLYKVSNSIKVKHSSGVIETLSVGVTPEEVQDIVGAFIQSQNNRITITYNDVADVLEVTLVEGNIVHQNLSGAGTNTHAQIDTHIANTSNPHATTAVQVGADPTGSAAAAQAFAIQRANHTGTQLASTISDFAATVRSTVLTGLSIATATAVVATDTILVAIGKLQAQINVWEELVTTSALNSASNVTLTSISALQLTVTNTRVYKIEGTILFRTAATTTGLALTMGNTGAAGTISLVINIPIAADGTAALYTGNSTAFGDIVTSTGVQAANTDYVARIDGIFVCTTSGTIVPQFRSEVNGSQVTVKAGSVLIAREF